MKGNYFQSIAIAKDTYFAGTVRRINNLFRAKE